MAGERILLIESDPDVSDVIARQTLQPLGYRVDIVSEAGGAIRQIVQSPPDLILTALSLPDLSGKDLLVAFQSQNLDVPIIVLAPKGHEPEVIQAFRLGAHDYLLWPARDAEIVAAVERALRRVRERRERERLDAQLRRLNEELQRRVRDLSTLLALGKAVLSVTDQRLLFQRILDAALQVGEANIAWLLLQEEKSKAYLLAAHKNLPAAWAKKLNQPLDDGLSQFVIASGETLAIHGAALQRFKVASLGKAAAIVPVKVQKEVIGVLSVVRTAEKPFEQAEQHLLEAIADYASISLVNAQLFRAFEKAAELAQQGERRQAELRLSLRKTVSEAIQTALYPLELVLKEQVGPLTEEQRRALRLVESSLRKLQPLIEQTLPASDATSGASTS